MYELHEGDLSSSQKNTLVLVTRLGASLSIFGSAMILLFWTRSNQRGQHQFCIVMLSISDILSSLTYGLSTTPFRTSDMFCTVQGFLVQFSISVPFWTALIALNFLLQTVYLMHDGDVYNIKLYYCVAAYLYPIASAIWITIRHHIDLATNWCWIDDQWQWERLIFWYIPLWSIFCFNFFCILFIVKQLREYMRHQFDRKIYRLTIQSFIFLIIYIIIWIPPTAHRFYQLTHDGRFLWPLAVCHAWFTTIQGFFNFCGYVGPLFYSHLIIFFRAYVLKERGSIDGGKLFTLSRVKFRTFGRIGSTFVDLNENLLNDEREFRKKFTEERQSNQASWISRAGRPFSIYF